MDGWIDMGLLDFN